MAAERPNGKLVHRDVKPLVAAFVSAKTISISPLVTERAPRRSKCLMVACPPVFGRNRHERMEAAIPIGTFTNITDLHPNAAVRTPPAIVPAANPADRNAT